VSRRCRSNSATVARSDFDGRYFRGSGRPFSPLNSHRRLIDESEKALLSRIATPCCAGPPVPATPCPNVEHGVASILWNISGSKLILKVP